MLLESLWGDSAYREPRTIDVHVRHLREKLERDPRRAGVHPDRARRRATASGTAERCRWRRRRSARAGAAARARGRASRWSTWPWSRRSSGAWSTTELDQLEDDRAEPARPQLPPAVPVGAAGRADVPHARTLASCVLLPASALADLLAVAGFAAKRSDAFKDDPIARALRRRRSALSAEPLSAVGAGSPRRRARRAENGPFLLLSAPLQDALEVVDYIEQSILIAGLLGVRRRAVGGLHGSQRLRPPDPSARARGRPDCRPAASTSRSSDTRATSSASSRERSTACASGSRGSTTRAREFIANASHELRTPIFSLGGHLELLDDEELDEETRRSSSARCARRSSRLGKLDRRAARPLSPGRRSPAGRAGARRSGRHRRGCVVGELRPLAQASRHTLESTLERRRSGRSATSQRVLQVARSLVENALRAHAEGTRSRSRAEPRDDEVELVVEDDGPGIPAEHRAHVFDRFYRVDGAMASGSGLGLAIARELAELMDGTLELAEHGGRTRSRSGSGPRRRFHVKTSSRRRPFPRENGLNGPSLQ